MTTLDIEKIFDIESRERLLDQSFGPDRHQKTCTRLRDGRLPADGLAFVARAQDRVVGTLRLWHVAAGKVPFLMLGPLAVDPLMRGEGIGSRMVVHALAHATELGHRAVFLVGDEPYYQRFGFSRAAAEKLVLPGPVETARFLARELVPGGLEGARGLIRPTGVVPFRPVQPALPPDIRRAA
jgi:predicted N-acetyltransferase YhbS